MNVDFTIASSKELMELAEFARRTYREAYQHEIDEPDLSQHLATVMTNEQFRAMFQEDDFFLARTDCLLGFAQLGPVHRGYGEHIASFDVNGFELKRLYVDHSSQNLKIGSRLIELVFSQPKLRRAEVIYVTTWETNLGAARLYESVGFERIGQIPDYSAKGELEGYEIVFAKPLTSL